jgi:hypothetical protein
MLSPYSISELIGRRISIIIFIILFVAVFLSRKFLSQHNMVTKLRPILILIFFTPSIVFLANELFLRTVSFDNSIFRFLNNYSSNVGLSLTGLLLMIMNTYIAFQLISIYSSKAKLSFSLCLKDGVNQEELLLKMNFIVIGLVGAGLLNSVTGGFEFPANLILGSFSIAFFLKYFEHQLKGNLFIFAFTVYFFLSSIQIGIHNYQWFGWNEVVSGHSIKDRTEEDLFHNFLLSGPQKNFYDQVRVGIDEAEKQLIDAKTLKPEIMTFPMQPIVTEMSSFRKYRLNCPILHFDVCPDNEAVKDLKKFERNPPDLVVLFDLGRNFIELNERSWRSGQISVYRNIQDFFLTTGKYSTVKIIEENSVNLARVYILVLNPGRVANE